VSATSKTIVRMWTKEGYHKDVLILDSDQVRMHDTAVRDSSTSMLFAGDIGTSMVIDPADFPEAVCFQVVVVEYRSR
jgi:hypothetical protein